MADFTEFITDSVGIADSENVSLDQATITDAVGITDTATPVKTIAVEIIDAVGITDTATPVKTVAITDAVGITDTATPVKTSPVAITDTVGITDTATPVKTSPVAITDTVGITDSFVADDSTPIPLPSIDGALPPSGIQLVNVDPSATIDFDLPSIDGASIPPGVNVYTANEEAAIAAGAQVYAHLYSAAGALLSTLDDMVAVKWQDVLNEPGIGTLTINRHDTDAALIVQDTEVRCYLYGQLVFTFIVENPPEMALYDPEDEVAELLVASGPGRIGRLSEALVYPVKGVVNPLSAAHRLYSFASNDYPNGGSWHNAFETVKADQLNEYRKLPVELTTLLQDEPDIVETIFLPPPLEWPDPDAYWIWGQLDTTVVGFNFFRKTFTLTEDSKVGFAVTGDNFYTLYLDGTPILGEDVENACWAEYKRIDIELPAGVYQLAAVVENIPGALGPGLNPAGFLCSVFSVNSATGDPANFIARSDSTWTVLNYPQDNLDLVYVGFPQWPGWTPGQVLIDAITEAQARGVLAGFTYSFTEWSDSAGNPWPWMEGFSAPIGSNLEDMINSMVEQGWVDYRLAPGGLVLDVYNQGYGVDTGIVLQATGIEATTNIERFSITPQDPPKTRLLVQWPGGQFEVEDLAAQAANGIKEAYIRVDAATKSEAIRQALTVLDYVKEPRDAIQVGLSPASTADRPYQAFVVGDLLDTPGRDETTNPEKVLSITVSHEGEGNPLIDLELQTRIQRREQQEVELLKMLGRGVSGSRKIRVAVYETTGLSR